MLTVLFMEATVGKGVVDFAVLAISLKISGTSAFRPVNLGQLTNQWQSRLKILKKRFVIRRPETAATNYEFNLCSRCKEF